jgi:hypothetical protein
VTRIRLVRVALAQALVTPADGRTVRGIGFLQPKRNPRLVQVVGAHLQFDHVSGGNLDVMLSQLTGNMSKNDVSVCQLNPKHGPWQDRYHPAFQFDSVALNRLGDGSLCRFGVGRLECFQNLSKTIIAPLATLGMRLRSFDAQGWKDEYANSRLTPGPIRRMSDAAAEYKE